jgi:hypothetical protein
MVIAQEPAQSLAAPHRSFALPIVYPRKQQDVALPLVVSLGMEMVEIVAQCPPQRALAEQDHFGQALLLRSPSSQKRCGALSQDIKKPEMCRQTSSTPSRERSPSL